MRRHQQRRSLKRKAKARKVKSLETLGDFRRAAYYMLPLTVANHALVIGALAPCSLWAHLPLAFILSIAALIYKRFDHQGHGRVTTVLGALVVMTIVMFPYVCGVLGPALAMHQLGLRNWIPWVTVPNVCAQSAAVAYFTKKSLRTEWVEPIDTLPNVFIDPVTGMTRWSPITRDSWGMMVAGCCLIAVFWPAMCLTYGHMYLLVVVWLQPVCMAFLISPVVGRVVTIYIVFRRWERAHGIRLRLAPLAKSC